jgi:hypothetical protein
MMCAATNTGTKLGGIILQTPFVSILSIYRTKKERGRLASIMTADMVRYIGLGGKCTNKRCIDALCSLKTAKRFPP